MWTAAETELEQNKLPTDFSKLDSNYQLRSDEAQQRFALDSRLHVSFYRRSIRDDAASVEAGRAIHREQECIKILIPGDKLNQIDRVASRDDKLRFPQHYQKFLAGVEQTIGTPLSAAPFLTQAQIDDYAYLNVKTMEQLAGMSDVMVGRIMGATDHKAKAQAFLDASKGVDALRAEFAAKDAARDAQMGELMSELARLRELAESGGGKRK